MDAHNTKFSSKMVKEDLIRVFENNEINSKNNKNQLLKI